MKKLAILMLLALELAVSGCGNSNTSSTTTSTKTSGTWEVQLTGGIAEASKLNFTTEFTVTNTGPLDIKGFSFFNAGACFANGANASTEAGSAVLTTNTGTNQVTGTLSFAVTSITPAGNSLSLTGTLTGTSNGTTTTTGTLSNGVVVGTWKLTGGAGDSSCAGQGSFVMCQGTSTCTVT
jgi:hypothetical protein